MGYDCIYARLTDMNQDGEDELFMMTDRTYDGLQSEYYTWDGANPDRKVLASEPGNIYIGSITVYHPGYYNFVGLTDSVELFRRDWDTFTEYTIAKNGVEREVEQDEFDAQLARFERIEDIDFDSYDWRDSLHHTVEEVKQQLMER